LGHQEGDKIIAQFAKLIATAAKEYGFIGRYGGDEFLAVFSDADGARAEEYLARVGEQVAAYNSLRVNDMEKISYAAGIAVGKLSETGIDDLIYEADRNMYAQKREMKKQL
jgi:diguanylate cyclase (GGDEF)-like protein